MTAVDRLRIKTLGNLAIELGEDSVPNFASRKAEALVVYLACNPRSHPREVLADLLWDDRSQRQSMANLRVILSSLRKEVGSYVSITRTIVAIDPDADLWLDSAELEATVGALQEDESHLHPTSVPELQEALALYEGDFLAGYFLPQAVGFETWAAAERERLHRLAITGLRRLGRWHLEQGEYQPAIRWATRLVAVDELAESGHRQLMGALALSGRRTEALRQYEAFRQLLQDELGIFPSEETESLYEAIRAGQMQRASSLLIPAATPQILTPSPRSPISSPAFLRKHAEMEREEPVFIGRELELARLRDELELALEGNGRILFVTGDAGSGKSSLMRAFAREASAIRQDALVAWGACNAFAGQGDPYLPFRDILATLAGDVEVALAAGTLTSQQASVLWQAMPAAVATLLDNGPDLLNTFVPGSALLSRLSSALPATDGLLAQLQQQLSTGRAAPDELQQPQLFEQVAVFLRSLSEQQPILLFLDDLQWADQASLSLLFHLGRRLAGMRLLLVGAYRAEEVALGRRGERHPLENVIAEFQRAFGQVILDLEDVDAERNRAFVDELVDVETNRLDEGFRRELHQHTLGHALFTIEMLRMLKANGDLLRDSAGYWVATPSLAWQKLPARVEAVIQERVDRLDPEAREVLAIASAVGEEFVADVVRRVAGVPNRRLLHILSQELGRRHRLLRERSDLTAGSQSTSRFRFSHHLIQRYAYSSLGIGERRLIHGEIARAIEDLFADDVETVTSQLAYHFRLAGDADKALLYLQRAGDRARSLYALQEAIESYESALALLREQAEPAATARLLMKLGLAYHLALEFEESRLAYEEGFALWQNVGAADANERPPGSHPLRAVVFEPKTLDPSRALRPTVWHMFSALIRLNSEMDVLPDVAHSWEVFDGGRKYVFRLREDVLWSDGHQVTAADFELAMKRALNPSTGSWAAALLIDIKNAQAYHRGELSDPELIGVRAPDRFTLEIELNRPAGYFLQLMARAYPLPRHTIERLGDSWSEPNNIVSNGPFRLKVWVPNRDHPGMVFEADPTYHGWFGGNVERVEVSFYVEYGDERAIDARKARLRRFGKGSLDWVGLQGLDPAEVRQARRRHADELVSLPLLSTAVLAFEARQKPFDDPRVRRAFALATDRESMANKALDGLHFPASGGFVPPGMPGHVAGIALPYDPDRARQLLAEAGYPDGSGLPRLSVAAPPWGGWGDRQEAFLTSSWLEILGAQVTYESLSHEERQAKVNSGAVHMWIAGWQADYPDPDNWLRVGVRVFSPTWQNARFEGLIEQARRQIDQPERLELYRQAEGILTEEVPFLPLYYRRWLGLLQPWIKNTPWDALRGEWFWQDIIVEDH